MNVRFAPSPTGSLHIGNALGAVASRTLGDTMPREARDLAEAGEIASGILTRPAVSLPDEPPALMRFRELRAPSRDRLDTRWAKAIVREVKAVGGHLSTGRTALRGRGSGPELWAALAAPRRTETLERVDAAL